MIKRKSIALAFGLLIALVLAAQASAKTPPRNVLGLSPGITEEAAHKILRRIGRESKNEGQTRRKSGWYEEWQLERDLHFAKVLVGFDGKNRVRYVTAFAKEGGRSMSYSEVATLKDAKAEGAGDFHRYTWEVKPGKKSPGYFVIAQGRDPQHLTSLSIKRGD